MNWLILRLGLYQAIWVTIGLDSDSVLNMWPSIPTLHGTWTPEQHWTTIYIQSCKMVKDFDTGIDVQSYNLWATTFEELVFLLQKLSSETPHMRNFFGTDGRSWKSKMLAPRLGVSNGKLSWNKWYWLIMINNVLIVVNRLIMVTSDSVSDKRMCEMSRAELLVPCLFLKVTTPGEMTDTHVNILHRYIYIYWLVVWNMNFMFPYIGNFIIPTDELIFFRGVETTNQYIYTWFALLFKMS